MEWVQRAMVLAEELPNSAMADATQAPDWRIKVKQATWAGGVPVSGRYAFERGIHSKQWDEIEQMTAGGMA